MSQRLRILTNLMNRLEPGLSLHEGDDSNAPSFDGVRPTHVVHDEDGGWIGCGLSAEHAVDDAIVRLYKRNAQHLDNALNDLIDGRRLFKDFTEWADS